MIKVGLLLMPLIMTLNLMAQDEDKPWEKTEVWEPVPPKVTPGTYVYATPPSDAIVLFDGKDLSEWQKPEQKENAEWIVEGGQMIVNPGTGSIETKRAFGNIQLHIEWNAPVDEGKEGQGYSNSGVFLMGRYEVQVLNNYKNKTYSNGQAGSIYKQAIPLVNASKRPGEWQAYDIIFKAPQFNSDGSLNSPARVTVLHNGVVVQNNTEIKGTTEYIGEAKYEAHPVKTPLMLQDHSDKVRYRNIWVREL
jgi:hypothetical protein